MELTCRKLTELLIDYVSGEMPPDEADLVARHLTDCPPCVCYLDTYRETIRLSRELPDKPVPDDLEAKLRAAYLELTANRCPNGP